MSKGNYRALVQDTEPQQEESQAPVLATVATDKGASLKMDDGSHSSQLEQPSPVTAVTVASENTSAQRPDCERAAEAISMRISLDSIDLDTSIQCRVNIEPKVVNEYAACMKAGDKFSPIELYGDTKRKWVGDGWHRILAAKKSGAKDILALVHPGGRAEALKHALGANAVHGQRRSSADKHHCVEIALREFPQLTSRAIANMCGVGKDLVERIRPAQVAENATSRLGADGKWYPAKGITPQVPEKAAAQDKAPAKQEKPAAPASVPQVGKQDSPVLEPPHNGMQFANMAIVDLAQIKADDMERQQAFRTVKEWVEAHENDRVGGRSEELGAV